MTAHTCPGVAVLSRLANKVLLTSCGSGIDNFVCQGGHAGWLPTSSTDKRGSPRTGVARPSEQFSSLSPQEIIESVRLDERAAADLNERQFAFLGQRVDRGGADAAQLMRASLKVTPKSNVARGVLVSHSGP
jgi:hypothetical protein